MTQDEAREELRDLVRRGPGALLDNVDADDLDMLIAVSEPVFIGTYKTEYFVFEKGLYSLMYDDGHPEGVLYIGEHLTDVELRIRAAVVAAPRNAGFYDSTTGEYLRIENGLVYYYNTQVENWRLSSYSVDYVSRCVSV